MVGDVNIPFCKHFDVPECLYRTEGNPYAPGSQRKTLEVKFSNFEKEVLQEVKSIDQSISLISVLFSGRPMIATEIIDESSAFIASWLPGTSGGQGIVNAIVGDYSFKPANSQANTLSVDWPKYMVRFRNNIRNPYKTSQFMRKTLRLPASTIHSSKLDMDYLLPLRLRIFSLTDCLYLNISPIKISEAQWRLLGLILVFNSSNIYIRINK